jgi:hypothetical protein
MRFFSAIIFMQLATNIAYAYENTCPIFEPMYCSCAEMEGTATGGKLLEISPGSSGIHPGQCGNLCGGLYLNQDFWWSCCSKEKCEGWQKNTFIRNKETQINKQINRPRDGTCLFSEPDKPDLRCSCSEPTDPSFMGIRIGQGRNQSLNDCYNSCQLTGVINQLKTGFGISKPKDFWWSCCSDNNCGEWRKNYSTP